MYDIRGRLDSKLEIGRKVNLSMFSSVFNKTQYHEILRGGSEL